MTRSRTSNRAAIGLVALLLAAAPASPAVAAEEGPLGPNASEAIDLRTAEPIDLLRPMGHLLSGRPWLMTEGLDPGLQQGIFGLQGRDA